MVVKNYLVDYMVFLTLSTIHIKVNAKKGEMLKHQGEMKRIAK